MRHDSELETGASLLMKWAGNIEKSLRSHGDTQRGVLREGIDCVKC